MNCPNCDCELELSLIKKDCVFDTKRVINSQKNECESQSIATGGAGVTPDTSDTNSIKNLMDKDYK